MAVIKQKEIKGFSEQESMKKLDELKLELLKALKPSHGASLKDREIKRTIARMLTHLAHLRSKTKKDKEK